MYRCELELLARRYGSCVCIIAGHGYSHDMWRWVEGCLRIGTCCVAEQYSGAVYKRIAKRGMSPCMNLYFHEYGIY